MVEKLQQVAIEITGRKLFGLEVLFAFGYEVNEHVAFQEPERFGQVDIFEQVHEP